MSKKYILQLGLAFTLLYAGVSSFLYPSDWLGFVPDIVSRFGLNTTTALHLHAAAEIALGLLLLASWRLKVVAGLVALDILAIIVAAGFSRGAWLITFRDVGLLTMACYLFLEGE